MMESDRPQARRGPRDETREPEFRMLRRIEAYDRQRHVLRNLEAGLSREAAERHADDDVASRAESSR